MKKIDYKLLISIILLSIFGIIMIYSSSSIWAKYKFNDEFRFLKLQTTFFIIGLILMYFISKINYKIYKKKANTIFIFCIILLLLVLIPGIGTIRNGSRSWFGVGGFGIQPSEFMKLANIIFVSKYLTNNPKSVKNVKYGIIPILLISLISFGLIMLQPDLGTGVIILMTTVSLLYVSGVDFSFFAKIGIVGIVLFIILILVAPYRIKRILAFIDPWTDPLGAGFQSIQSLFAIGPGGLLGFGLFNSVQKHFYLPEPQTDFIFSIISEELGIFGIIIVASFFIFIIYRCLKISILSSDIFAKYLSFGIAFQLSFQTLLNLSVVVGLIPITGVTLPFLSYGGSSLIITMMSMGIILNISSYS